MTDLTLMAASHGGFIVTLQAPYQGAQGGFLSAGSLSACLDFMRREMEPKGNAKGNALGAALRAAGALDPVDLEAMVRSASVTERPDPGHRWRLDRFDEITGTETWVRGEGLAREERLVNFAPPATPELTLENLIDAHRRLGHVVSLHFRRDGVGIVFRDSQHERQLDQPSMAEAKRWLKDQLP